MADQITIAGVIRASGTLQVRLDNKRGYVFKSAADAQAILDAVRASLGEEALVVAAIKKVGAINADTLVGKTVTLVFDVTIV